MNALLIGCGAKFGLGLLNELLAQGWTVYSISGKNIDPHENLIQFTVDWNSYNQATIEAFLKNLPNIDLVFFNQNASSLNDSSFKEHPLPELFKLEKQWSQTYFSSCILPFHIVNRLRKKFNPSTKIVWMLSSYIYQHTDIKNSDYLGNKFQNYITMKNFSLQNDACYMGFNPDNLNNRTIALSDIAKLLADTTKNFNGQVVHMDGTVDNNFDFFTK